MSESNEQIRLMRKSFACDECKRRKIRCSGGDQCANCSRDAKSCRYSSPSQRLVSLQRRLRHSENTRLRMEKAWKAYLPDVDLETALSEMPENPPGPDDSIPNDAEDAQPHGDVLQQASPAADVGSEQPPAAPMEHSNAEDYEFDESQDMERSIDGMAFLTSDPHKAGYTGPQSGIAALKFLQSLPPYLPITYSSPLSGLDDKNVPQASSHAPAAISHYIDEYFSLYHPAYPILHEGTFRARVSGALPKPRDGSWSLLYNSVLAIGAFVSSPDASQSDFPFLREARKHLSMDILEKGSLGYVQAITLFANYLQKRNKPNAGFVLIGFAFSMALAIGLHREFDTSHTSPFTMEVRRRVWWTLFVFVSGAHLALGRPAASLVGVNVQLPTNLDDLDLAVDMDQMPSHKSEPTVSSCLIAQVNLAKIGNAVHDELLTHRRPSYAKAMELEERIRAWWDGLPSFFNEKIILEPRFELPKRVLLWRSFNLRIVLNRPFLFELIAAGAQLSVAVEPVKSCLGAADECVASICSFLKTIEMTRRGFAWYATAWLVTASFVQATCLIYCPSHSLAASWMASLQQAVDCLEILGSSLDIACRAKIILQNVLGENILCSLVRLISARPLEADYIPLKENRSFLNLSYDGTFNPLPNSLSLHGSIPDDTSPGVNQPANHPLSPIWSEECLTWLSQEQNNAEFLGAAEGFMYGNVFDVS